MAFTTVQFVGLDVMADRMSASPGLSGDVQESRDAGMDLRNQTQRFPSQGDENSKYHQNLVHHKTNLQRI